MQQSIQRALAAFIVSAGAAFSFSADAAVWYVDAARPSSGAGTSWATAFRTVREAVQAASTSGNDEVWVRSGEYPEVTNNGGNSLEMREQVDMYGGFAGGETSRDQRNPVINETVLLGTATGPDDRTPTAPVVLAASNALIDGFVIRGGRSKRGGGMMCFRTSPTVRNCVFEDNVSIQDELITRSGWGGGVMVVGGVTPLFEDCVFRENYGLLGGGMALENGKPTLRRCRFEDNYAYIAIGPVPGVPGDLWQDQTGSGGGVFGFEQASMVVENCVFDGNQADTQGGGIAFYERGDANITDTVFTNNTSIRDPEITGYFPAGRGGALGLQWDSSTFERCLFVGNTSSDDGGAVFTGGLRPETNPGADAQFLARAKADPTFINCIFLENTAQGTGGGAMFFEATGTFTHCTFAGNQATRNDPTSGGGIHALWFAEPVVKNSILWNNTPYDVFDLPEVEFDPGEGEVITVPGSATHATYSNIGVASSAAANMSGALLVGAGNISALPKFTLCGEFDRAEDVALQSGSPSLGTGNAADAAADDYFGVARGGGAPDMGAIEGAIALDCGGFEGTPHSADQNGDGVLSLSDLLRVVQFFNVGGLRCSNGSEDGYAPGIGNTSCAGHASDYAPRNWILSLNELLRTIQLFNAGSYTECAPGEDGYCQG
ncbi:MAG: hypothetical protein GC168_07430 [Candidatus Hydrogenedens sp.]|nr:hypothetical protein [Candidatus Hydrogenedens sp.]